MDKYQQTFDTWNKVAQAYQDKFMNLDLYNESYDLFCDAIPKQNASLFEIGCGPGNITRYLLHKRPDFNIIAIDVAPNMIELAKANNPKAHFSVMDTRNINQIKTLYDGIVCGFCLPYLSQSDVAKLISDCNRLLYDEGILYLSFVEGDYAKSGPMTGSTGDSVYFYYHDWEALRKELLANHFEITHRLHIGYDKSDGTQETHTIVLAKKSAAAV